MKNVAKTTDESEIGFEEWPGFDSQEDPTEATDPQDESDAITVNNEKKNKKADD